MGRRTDSGMRALAWMLILSGLCVVVAVVILVGA
jgi:hypothetical protein